MNKNIEIINPYLVGVSFSHIEMGWITDFPLLHGRIRNPHLALSTDGILLLDKDDPELFKIAKRKFHEEIMPLSDQQLLASIQELELRKGNPSFGKGSEVQLWMLQTEQTRRTAVKPQKKGVKSLWQRFRHQ